MRDAFAGWHMGRVCCAYRRHPFHGSDPLSQELVGRWLGITQPQLSRIEHGPPIRDLDKLIHWARTLRIPPYCLWFDLPGSARGGVLQPQAQLDEATCIPYRTESLDRTVRTVVELSERDMNRRTFLRGSAFTAAAFSESALLALTVPPASSAATASASGRRVGIADVEILTEHLAHLRRLDHRYGAGRVREQVVQLLHREAGTVLHGSYSEETGRALLGAVAQASWLAGSMAADVGRHALAQRYYTQTLNLAMRSDDRLYASYVLSHMSRMTVQFGDRAAAEDGVVRNGRQAVALARAGLRVATGGSSPALSALLHAVEARGHALLGDASATRAAITAAERLFGRSRPDDEPSWLRFYTEAELSADAGRCLRDIGEIDHATRLMDHALAGYEPWRARSRCFVQTDLVLAYLRGGDMGRAAVAGRQALSAAEDVSSTRTSDRIRGLARRVRSARAKSRELVELDEAITDFLARAASGQRWQ